MPFITFLAIRHTSPAIRHISVQNILEIRKHKLYDLPLLEQSCNKTNLKYKIMKLKRRTIIGVVFIVVALLKLASMWGIMSFDWMWREPWPTYFMVFMVFYFGVELVISSYQKNPDQWLTRPIPPAEEGKRIKCSAHFGGDEYIYKGEPFHGARLDAFCGGIRLDLRKARITEDEEIEIHTFLGGVELLVPETVNVVTESHTFIGEVENEANRNLENTVPCLHIIASNIFGGVSIKNK